ncbi:MAG TPA: hypothetical protein VHG92_05510, partial [Afifellaceae bacterium]|nr:hypothetical protein [Afifellaceae bacterium]
MVDGHGQAAADEPDWAAVKAVYEAGEVPVETLRRQFGISRYRLTQKRVDGCWRTRSRVAHPGPPGVPRRPIELAIENIVRL